MLSAKSYVALIGAKENLGAFPYNFSVCVSSVALSALAAPTDSGDFLDHICDFHQPPGAWEKMVQEIGPQAVADYRNVVEVYKVRQDIHFLRGKELCLVYQNCVYLFPMIQIFYAVCIPDLGNLF